MSLLRLSQVSLLHGFKTKTSLSFGEMVANLLNKNKADDLVSFVYSVCDWILENHPCGCTWNNCEGDMYNYYTVNESMCLMICPM